MTQCHLDQAAQRQLEVNREQSVASFDLVAIRFPDYSCKTKGGAYTGYVHMDESLLESSPKTGAGGEGTNQFYKIVEMCPW